MPTTQLFPSRVKGVTSSSNGLCTYHLGTISVPKRSGVLGVGGWVDGWVGGNREMPPPPISATDSQMRRPRARGESHGGEKQLSR